MLVVHLSLTPLVGAPGSICRALNTVPGVQARWAVLDTQGGAYDKMAFEMDLQWALHREEILDLVGRCDLLHLHNFIDLDCQAFAPIDFRALWARGLPMVRHFHSNPELVARAMGQTVQQVLGCPIPKLVIGQYPERYYPDAQPVPNMVFVPPREPVPTDAPLRIGYAPSRFTPARSSRWDTKGYPETVKLLARLGRSARQQGLAVEFDLIEQVGHTECLRRKTRCDLFIDDLVTGSYHLNTLEALQSGLACATFLDRRTLEALAALTGQTDFPAINVGMENAHDVLLALCRDATLVREIGLHSRQWMERHWRPDWVAGCFLAAYDQVTRAPGQAFPARFDTRLRAQQWLNVGLHDELWRSRQAGWPSETSAALLKIRAGIGRTVRRVLGR
ncbi:MULTISPECIES: hypothetical protein [unclassified Rubrivivax]|uniref:hypothetical protein n=1 Tax=unclassified Rubrivivax TaxID=2649762 RepID=UPI001E62C6BC|nr:MULTISPECIES: hypothetical protein [unclassified Rubrivivax]MCC9596346.1 hypothetical protein [Rubrivivax sp. JA1055]MCC9647312.1 hypothetical protein [Rubrivivax sp. JA1029]